MTLEQILIFKNLTIDAFFSEDLIDASIWKEFDNIFLISFKYF
jgi:hypothetical protein